MQALAYVLTAVFQKITTRSLSQGEHVKDSEQSQCRALVNEFEASGLWDPRPSGSRYRVLEDLRLIYHMYMYM